MKYIVLLALVASAAMVSADQYDDSAPQPQPYQGGAPQPYQGGAPQPYQGGAPGQAPLPEPVPIETPPLTGGYVPPPPAGACPVTYSNTYKAKLPTYDHLRCDAVKSTCYPPASYGTSYNPKSYSYTRKYPYPGPLKRFKYKLKKLGKAIKNFFKGIKKSFCHSWDSFKDKWNTWCAKKKSDWDRFQDWKKCKAQEWKDWWGYYHDLCRTRKQLWDNAQREFHRQWCHYKKTHKAEYEASKKKCSIQEKDYDESPEYKTKINEYGVSPVEQYYDQSLRYDPNAYTQHCQAKDAEYYKEHPNEKPHY